MSAIVLGLALLASGTTGFADTDLDYDTAIRRLRACITSGAAGAPRGDLSASVAAVRALCGHQIRAAQVAQSHKIEQENPAPQTQADEGRLAKLKADAAVRLNNEIAVLIAKATGYTG